MQVEEEKRMTTLLELQFYLAHTLEKMQQSVRDTERLLSLLYMSTLSSVEELVVNLHG